MSSSTRREVRAGLIVRPPSFADGFVREVVGNDSGNVIPESHAVVGATVLWIDLGRVRQVEPWQTGAMIGNPLAVIERNDWLCRPFTEDPGSFDPGAAEFGIDPLQEWDVRVDQLVVRHREVGMVRLQIFRKV